MSAFINSGSAQLAVLQSWSATSVLAPAVLVVIIANARYLLYGAALRPWLASLPPLKSYGTLFFVGDAQWALSMLRFAQGQLDAGFVLGSGLAMYLPWVAGALIGSGITDLIGNVQLLALDFLLIGFATTMALSAWKRTLLLPALAALLAALICNRVAPGGWTIAASGMAGGLTAFVCASSSRAA